MRLTPDREAEIWLLGLSGAAGEFEWDAGNLTKSRKHGVEPSDIRTLIARDFYFAGRILEPAHHEPRWLLLGEDATGRRLALIFTRRGRRLRPIRCRPMRRQEKALYEKASSKEED